VANLRNEVKYLGPLSLIEHVIEETGYGASLLALPDGKAKYTNLNKLINIVARLETLGLGISEILDYLESSFGEDAESVPQAELEHENSVKILTVHKAKGLEFPVVILSDLNHAPGGGSRERLMARREKGFMVRCDGSKSSLWESTVKAESEDSLEEEKRILYVAATRAKERLIISAGGKKLKAGNMKLSSGSFAAFLDSVIGFPPNFEEEKQITLFGLEIPLWQGMKEEGTKIKIEDERELKPLNIKDLERRLSFIAQEGEDRSKEYYVPLTHAKPSSVEVGKLMHRFLEVWDFKSDSIDTTIRFVIRENYVIDDTIEKELSLLAKNFLDSPLREKINEAEAIFREVPFYMEINGRADRGKIDLILKAKGELSLFDYKHISDHAGINEFKEQLGRYTAAIERHFGKTPGERFIVLLPEVRLVFQD
jgi:ATP-dependent exoDNAse (exonuclease V) beta subunit